MSRGLLRGEDIATTLRRARPDCRTVLLCDCYGGGTPVDLPFKLHAHRDGTIHRSMINPSPRTAGSERRGQREEGRVLQLSSCRDGDVAGDAGGSGLAQALAAVLHRSDAEPSCGALLTQLRRAIEATQGGGGAVAPMASATWRLHPDEPLGLLAPAGAEHRLDSRLFVPVAPRGGAPIYVSPPRTYSPSSTAASMPVVAAAADPRSAPLTPTGGQALPPPLNPEALRARIPSLLAAPEFEKLLSWQSENGFPEIWQVFEAAVLETPPPEPLVDRQPRLSASAKYILLGQQALYVLEPDGELDRTIPVCDVQDFCLFSGGMVINADVAGGDSYVLPGTPADAPWLAVRVPSQHDLLLQPIVSPAAGGVPPAQAVAALPYAVNALLAAQQPPAAAAQVLPVHDASCFDGRRTGFAVQGLLRLSRPAAFSYTWIPLRMCQWMHH